jgi:hypothetical protein
MGEGFRNRAENCQWCSRREATRRTGQEKDFLAGAVGRGTNHELREALSELPSLMTNE